ncbi:MAG TPA: tetratricopeptide repeat protein [Thermoanaerobaculia bacterium]|nr:tetratricopeptide repeat protein [Thermoanaerobaculia bacterium]
MDILKPTKPLRFPLGGGPDALGAFVAGADPALVASLQAEEKDQRRRWHRRSLALLLPLLFAVIALAWQLPRLYAPLDIARSPTDVEKARSLAEEGHLLLLHGGLEQARTQFRMVLKFAPHLPDGWAGLGAIHHYGYQEEKAEGLLRKALALDPGHEPALLLLGEIAYARDRQDEAEALWKKCSDQSDLGKLYLRQGRFQEAARILESETRKNPGDESLQKMAAAARAGRLTPDVEQLIRPDYLPSRSPIIAKGWDTLAKDRPGEAVRLFEAALAQDPRSVQALTGMGWTLFESGRIQECRRYFDQALGVQPGNPVALNGQANCLHAEGRTEEAMAIWKELDAIYSGRSSGTKHLGWRYYERGDCEQAAGYFARWIAFNRGDRPAMDALEDCLQKLGRRPSTPAPQTRP